MPTGLDEIAHGSIKRYIATMLVSFVCARKRWKNQTLDFQTLSIDEENNEKDTRERETYWNCYFYFVVIK